MQSPQLDNVHQTHWQQRGAQLVALGGGQQRLMLGVTVNQSRQLAIQTPRTLVGARATRATAIHRIYKKIKLRSRNSCERATCMVGGS
jgi:hypothetical protein